MFLDQRAAELSLWLCGTELGTVEKLVLPLLVTLPAKAAGSTDAGYIRRIYAETISPLPHFAIAAACRDFLTRRVGTGWMPDPGEIYQRAEFHAEPWRTELAEIREVLEFAQGKAVAISAPDRDIGALLRETANSMRMSKYEAPLAVDVEASPIEEYRGKPLRLSDEVLAKLDIGSPAVAAE